MIKKNSLLLAILLIGSLATFITPFSTGSATTNSVVNPLILDLYSVDEHEVAVGFWTWIDINIDYYGTGSLNVSIDLVLRYPDSSELSLQSLSFYHFRDENGYDYYWDYIDLLFNETGRYDIFLFVEDLNSEDEWTHRYFFDVEEDVVRIWIDQSNHAFVGEETWIYFGVDFLVTENLTANIKLWISNETTNVTIYENNSLVLHEDADSMDWFMDSTSITFNTTGFYDVYYEIYIVEWDEYDYEDCWYEVHESFWEGWIIGLQQENEILVNTLTTLTFVITNISGIASYVNLEIRIAVIGENEVFFESNSTATGSNMNIEAGHYLTFDSPGSYDVVLEIYDTVSEYWYYDYCWYEVYPEEDLDWEIFLYQEEILSIGQDSYIGYELFYSGETPQVYFDVELWITGDDIDYSVLFSNHTDVLIVPDLSYPVYHYSYKEGFAVEGFYDVTLIIKDITHGKTFYRYCEYEVVSEILDDSSPDLTVYGITDGALLNDTVNITLVLSDNSELANGTIEISVDGTIFLSEILSFPSQSISRDGTQTLYEVTGSKDIDTKLLDNGTYDINICAMDIYGNIVVVAFTVDITNTLPVNPTTTTTTTTTDEPDESDPTSEPEITSGFGLLSFSLLIIGISIIKKRQ